MLDFPFILPQQGVIGGIVRGAGKQMVGAVVNLVGFYVIGLPIGVSLMFPVKMGIVGENPVNILISDNLIIFPVNWTNCPFSIAVVGLWTGLLVSVLTQCIFFAPFLWKLNWKKATEEVSNSIEDIHECYMWTLTSSMIAVPLLSVDKTMMNLRVCKFNNSGSIWILWPFVPKHNVVTVLNISE